MHIGGFPVSDKALVGGRRFFSSHKTNDGSVAWASSRERCGTEPFFGRSEKTASTSIFPSTCH